MRQQLEACPDTFPSKHSHLPSSDIVARFLQLHLRTPRGETRTGAMNTIRHIQSGETTQPMRIPNAPGGDEPRNRAPSARKRETRTRMPTAPYDSGEFQLYAAKREEDRRAQVAEVRQRAVAEADLDWIDLAELLDGDDDLQF